jgi:hypothetical protein
MASPSYGIVLPYVIVISPYSQKVVFSGGGSPIRAELPDMFNLVKKDEGPPVHDVFILILQILERNTNTGNNVWGNAMHHRGVNVCSIDGLFFLMARFDTTGKNIDFSNTISWFVK